MRVTSERVCIGSSCKSFCKAVSPLCTFCKFRKNYKTKNFGRYSHTLRPFCVREKSLYSRMILPTISNWWKQNISLSRPRKFKGKINHLLYYILADLTYLHGNDTTLNSNLY